MITTILLDLDGTVLSMDMDLFMKIYFSEMSKAFSDLPEDRDVAKNIWVAIDATIKNTDPGLCNEEVFMDTYAKLISGDINDHKQRFDAFYDAGYLKAKDCVHENEWMGRSIRLLQEKGYQLVLATNPIFPLKAILHRITWAGFEPEEFSYISSFEKNHYCKPQIKYYEEVLNQIGRIPEECLMVGNDVQEDMIISELGVKTYLIDNHILNRTTEPIQVDYQGDYEAFFNFVKELPTLN